jgi:CHAD domain-containing protein
MRRASSGPEITFARMPVCATMAFRKSPPFSASRVALVAAATMSSTPYESASRLNLVNACSAAFIALGVRARPSRPPAPSRTISFSRSITSNEKSGRIRTTIMCTELVPMSMAAIFMEIRPAARRAGQTPSACYTAVTTGSTLREKRNPIMHRRHSSLDALLERRVEALTSNLPGARLGDEAAVHQARVASRRLRELIPIAGASAGERPMRKAVRGMKRLTRALGPVRELDVALGLLDQCAAGRSERAAAVAAVRRHLEAQRRDRRRALSAALRRAEVADLLGAVAWMRAAAAAHDGGWRVILSARIRRRGEELRDRVEAAGVMYNGDALHAARIAAKKLRYALEMAGQLGVPGTSTPVRYLKRVQDRLGALHDREVLARIALGVAARSATLTEPDTALARQLEDDCRRIHAQYLRKRDRLFAIADEAAEFADAVLVRSKGGRPRDSLLARAG